ncbi:DUF5688 family protein [Faecalicatena contorta]|uniref:DUF5688 family protein n=1 Tax=Faecalicatena contorta TaxID=39482 RepID=UPI001F2692F4|nr:DUF5688 family protein [Faecalicatena contorta]MCF2554390.1 hypothetical protein [Faecalicatena contorta]
MFKYDIQQKVQEKLEGNAEVYTYVIHKNNNVQKEALTFKKEGITYMPVIYLRDFFEEYEKGVALDDLVDMVLDIYQKAGADPIQFENIVPEWHQARPNVRMRVLNKKWNQEQLEKQSRIFFDYLDLAIEFVLLLHESSQGSATMRITEDMLEKWGISDEELLEAAKENLYQEEFDIKGINSILKLEKEQNDEGFLEEFYVLSNKEQRYGAVGILREDLLSKLAEEEQVDLFVIPSSVHEVLLFKVQDDISADKLKEMVVCINRDEDIITPEDVLSDSIYLYERGGEIKIAA